ITFISKDGKLKIKLDDKNEKLMDQQEKEVTVGIRPEDISDTKTDNKNMQQIEATLEVVEPMGNEIFLYFTLADSQIIARIPAREKPDVGKKVNLYLNLDKLHFFDKTLETKI
ncbi:MAG: TOBE domain-containing protein, partial [Ignavibacteriales bacterium]|nr:TOBE domain-containing protein [Ignavibacteriales bacterium]